MTSDRNPQDPASSRNSVNSQPPGRSPASGAPLNPLRRNLSAQRPQHPAPPRRPQRRPLPRTTLTALLALSATLLGTAAALPHDRPAPGRPLNVLLLGTDERDTISTAEKHRWHAGGQACGCSDSMMLVHFSARRDRVSVVGLPRDSYATIPAHRDGDGRTRPAHGAKLNAAFQEGGAELAMKTVGAMTGVRIDRYLQVDFRRFIDSVDQVGGVEVCTPRRLKDSATKIDLAPGKHRLMGGPALEYVRSRHVDNSADLGRIQRQQRFLVQALRGLQARGLLADPKRTFTLMRTLLGSGPQGFGPLELARLAGQLKKLPASRTEFTTVPISGFNPVRKDIGATLAWDTKAAAKVFGKIRADQPLLTARANPRPKDPPSLLGAPVPVRGSAYGCR